MSDIIFKEQPFTKEAMDTIKGTFIDDYPVVYIIYNNDQKPMAYIGQTVHAKQRIQQHLKDQQRKKLNATLIIGYQKFNQSATYNIETNLINYFIADSKYQLQNMSQTTNSQVHNYFDKHYYHREVFREIWSGLKSRNIVKEEIDVLENKDVFKLSPYKSLSASQLKVKEDILDYCNKQIHKDGQHVFLIKGEAGTGKSVVLSSLFNTLQDYSKDTSSPLYKTNNYLLVNHGEMIKTYQSIASSLPNLKKSHFLKPTSFINKVDKGSIKAADVVLVDEAHLLLSKEDTYNNFNYQNHLEEIIKRSKVTVIIFDPKQFLKIKSYWNEASIREMTKQHKTTVYHLTDQFRIQASEAVPTWIDAFVENRLVPIPNKLEGFELKVFESSQAIKEAIFKQNEAHGLSRLVSTFDYLHKKDGNTYLVDEGGIQLPWNTTSTKTTWAEEASTVREVGSIYTVQGFDLNYVGVIIGPSISYDPHTDQLVINPKKYKDTEAYRKRQDLSESENEHLKIEIILNSLNVLMKRGIHGLYIYATDDKLRKKLLALQEEGKHV
ncbi:DUF2075 domain-containing protein [Amphibacillus cookii]|uniref:DUF2075 domain-containing protein n=1 Tax=Amphibacillus cookii TaxID=767787 RepID=UPI00195EAA0F|nr:DUF2075 domain-containing protein [Amphibacillus cookii]MBM7541185.1 DUF2075 family protein/predicted GIY-YIG superfamily endonuclease [Amphibacillus cookii]